MTRTRTKATTAARMDLALSKLANGPWPVRATWALVGDRDTLREQHNAGRTLARLEREGYVRRAPDASGTVNWYLVRGIVPLATS